MALSQTELKKLFARSGNICAYPNCTVHLVDEGLDVVLGEVAHIRAKDAGGPRYDPAYPEELLDTARNTMLLCPTHHTTIDKAVGRYPIATLEGMKRSHEARESEKPTEEMYGRLLGALGRAPGTIVSVTSFGQQGGQTAAIIQNQFGPATRTFGDERQGLSEALANLPDYAVSVSYEQGAHDGPALAEEILKTLRELGRTKVARGSSMTVPPPKGIQVKVAGEGTAEELAVAQAFASRGWKTVALSNGRLREGYGVEITIGLP